LDYNISMYQIVHGTTGILIGSQTGNPYLAFILGLISHFILDAIPHDSEELRDWQNKGDYIKKIAFEAMLDLFVFLVILYSLMNFGGLELNYAVGAGVIGALLPDYIWGAAELFHINNIVLEKYKAFHSWAHGVIHKAVYLPWYLVVPIQIGFLIILIILILIL